MEAILVVVGFDETYTLATPTGRIKHVIFSYPGNSELRLYKDGIIPSRTSFLSCGTG